MLIKRAFLAIIREAKNKITSLRHMFIKAIYTGKIYGCASTQDKQLVIADMHVLGQSTKTGIYRVCDEIYKRLNNSNLIILNYYVKEPFAKQIKRYLDLNNFKCSTKQQSLDNLDANIVFFISPFGPPPRAIAKRDSIRHIHFIYDLIAINHPEYFSKKASKEVKNIMNSLSNDDIIFSISEYTKTELLNYRRDLNPNQITTIPLAADTRFKPDLDNDHWQKVADKYNIPSDCPYILSLATLEIRKNIETTIEAFNTYLKDNKNSNLNLIISGMTGWKLDRLKTKLKKYDNIKERIFFTGYVDDADLPVLYSNAVAFIYMSRSEGFGLPPLESMACGTPVITSNNSSLPEVVGEAGFMFDCNDYLNVANIIGQLYDDKVLRKKYSELSLARAKNFSWDKTTDIILNRLKTESEY